MQEYKVISDYLLDLREKHGYDYYTKEEMLHDYERHINCLANGKYDDYLVEYDSDWEFWQIIFDLIDILILNRLYDHESMKDFITRYRQANTLLLDNLIPVKEVPGLPWYSYSVLKKAGRLYAEDVKLHHGIDIEIHE